MPQQENCKKQKTPSERSLKKALGHSGYSEYVADKIWNWYNPEKK
jgi:hypothetical protein